MSSDAAQPRRVHRTLDWLSLPAAVGLIGITLALAVAEMRPSEGYDFRPMYQAGWSVLHAQPVYDVPMFGYPPFAALFFVPFALADWASANQAYAVFQMLVAMAGSAVLGAALFRGHRLLGAAAVSLALLGSYFFWSSVHLYNVSQLMILPLVVVPLLWSRARWTAGALVLAVSVAIKPLLAPLFLVPPAHRKIPALVWGIACVVGLSVLGALFSNDVDGLFDLPRRVILGANELGDVQIYNISPNSIGIIHPGLAPAMTALRILLAVGIILTLWRARRWGDSFEGLLVITGVLAMTMPLVGTLSEIHYSILAFPMGVAMVTGRLGRASQVVALIGLVVLAFGFHGLNDAGAAQIQLCAGQVIVMIAAFFAKEPRVPGEVSNAFTDGVLQQTQAR